MKLFCGCMVNQVGKIYPAKDCALHSYHKKPCLPLDKYSIVIGKPHTDEHDWRCRFCGHDVTEHEDVHRPFGQSSKTCFHGTCKCSGFESIYELCGGIRSLEFVSGVYGMDLGQYHWKQVIDVTKSCKRKNKKTLPAKITGL